MQQLIKVNISTNGEVFIDGKMDEDQSKYMNQMIHDNFKIINGMYRINKNIDQTKIDNLLKDIQNDFYCTKLDNQGELLSIGIVEPFNNSSFTYMLKRDEKTNCFSNEILLEDVQLLHNLDFINAVKRIDHRLCSLLSEHGLKIELDYKAVPFEEIDEHLKGLDMINPMNNEQLVLIEGNRWNVYNPFVEEMKYNYFENISLDTIIKERLLDIAQWYGSYLPMVIGDHATNKDEYTNARACLDYIINIGDKYLSSEELSHIHQMKEQLQPTRKESLKDIMVNAQQRSQEISNGLEKQDRDNETPIK